MTETHVMGSSWYSQYESVDSGHNAKYSRIKCIDCGAKFNYNALCDKGYFNNLVSRRG